MTEAIGLLVGAGIILLLGIGIILPVLIGWKEDRE